ncbi:MAG: response regulator [Chlorobi bacterium]|nr:response regulator [Chlorobiota bacterium]
MESRKILIAEDDKLLATIFRMFIKELGYELVGIVISGEDAINKCEEFKPDVVLMDIHLKGELNGIETAKIIQEKLNLPVIFISHDTREETIKSAISIKTYGFLAKPIDISSLGVSIELAYFKHKKNQESSINDHLYKSLIEYSPDAVIVLLDNKLEYLNKSAAKLFSLEENPLKQPIQNLFLEKASKIIMQEIEKALKTNRKLKDIEVTIPHLQGDNLYLKISGTIIEFQGQEFTQLVLHED